MLTSRTQTFAILYGIGEGRIIGWRMRRELKRRGFREAKPEVADIILTHSAGVYVLPPGVRAELFVHLNCATYLPVRRLLSAHWQKLRYDIHRRRAKNQLVRWFLAGMANVFYLFNIPHGLRMRPGFLHSDQVLANLPQGQHIFICGYQDGLSNPHELLSFTDQRHTYITIPAGHDDCWREPETFIDTMEHFILAQKGEAK